MFNGDVQFFFLYSSHELQRIKQITGPGGEFELNVTNVSII